MEIPERSRNRDKVCWTRDNIIRQDPTQWMARGEAIGSSRSTSKRLGPHYSVPESRAGRPQHNDGNIEYGRTLDQNEG